MTQIMYTRNDVLYVEPYQRTDDETPEWPHSWPWTQLLHGHEVGIGLMN